MADRIYHKCPQCNKVSYFQEGQPLVCKKCGHAVQDDASDELSSATWLGIGSIGLAVLALVTFPFLPFAIACIAGSVGCAIGAFVQREDDDNGAAIAAGIGLAAAGIAAFIIWWLYSWDLCPNGCATGGSSGGDGGTDRGGSSGGGGGGGGSGGGVDFGGGGGGGVGAPIAELPFIGLALLALTGWRMRRA